MSVPSSYNQGDLTTYMRGELQRTAPAIEAEGFAYAQPILNTLLAYGVSTLAEATDVPRLLKLARVAVWRAAVAHLAPRVDQSDNGRSLDRSQFYDHAVAELERAETDALDVSTAHVARRVEIRYRDRYSY